MPSASSAIFPDDLATFAEGGPVFQTLITMSADGTEQRNALSLHPRREYSINTGIIDVDLADDALAFLGDRIGSYQSFLLKDQFDYIATAQPLITVAGGARQLCRAYTHGSYTYYRPITKPISTITVSGGGTVDYSTGLVTGGSGGTWTGTFRVPVRIDQDALTIVDNGGDQRNAQIRLIEVWDLTPGIVTGTTIAENIGSGNASSIGIGVGASFQYIQKTEVVGTTLLAEDRFLDWTTAERALVSGKWLLADYTHAQYLLNMFLVARGRRSRWSHDLLGTSRFTSDALIMHRISFDSYEADLATMVYIA